MSNLAAATSPNKLSAIGDHFLNMILAVLLLILGLALGPALAAPNVLGALKSPGDSNSGARLVLATCWPSDALDPGTPWRYLVTAKKEQPPSPSHR